MIPPETKLSKVRGVTLALICLAVIGLCKILCAPGKFVVRAFRDLLEDETHLEKITKQMKGG